MERRTRLTLWTISAALVLAALVLAGGPWRGGGGGGEEALQRGQSATPESVRSVDVVARGAWSDEGGATGIPRARATADGEPADDPTGTSTAETGAPSGLGRPPRSQGTTPVDVSIPFSSEGARSAQEELATDEILTVPLQEESEAADKHEDEGVADPRAVNLVALEEEAARVASQLGLVDPDDLELKIDELVPSRHLTPTQLQLAREAARREILADAAIVEDLVRARYRETGSLKDARMARGFIETLLPAWGDDFRAQRLEGIADRLLL